MHKFKVEDLVVIQENPFHRALIGTYGMVEQVFGGNDNTTPVYSIVTERGIYTFTEQELKGE